MSPVTDAQSPGSGWSPLLVASVALHAVALGTCLARPALWPWAAGLVFADHVLLMSLGLLPRSQGIGGNVTHLRAPGDSPHGSTLALTFDDGPDPHTTPKVLDLLAETGHRATFFLIGRRAEQHPELVQRIVDEGHEIANHSWSHPFWFCVYPPHMLRREIERCSAVLEQYQQVRWFRAPAGLRNALLAPLLAARGLRLASWTRRGFDTARGDPGRVHGDLVRDLEAGDILLLHDAGAAETDSGSSVALEVLPRLLDDLEQRGLRSVTLSAATTVSRRGEGDAP